jgi:ketosteroid isomerase-like protein
MADLERFVRALNDTWRAGRFVELVRFFHADVVMLPPTGGTPIRGAGPMVESYRQFNEVWTVHDFTITDVQVFGFDPVAICHAHFRIDYELGGARSKEHGIEVYVIDTRGPQPKVVWRTQLPAVSVE